MIGRTVRFVTGHTLKASSRSNGYHGQFFRASGKQSQVWIWTAFSAALSIYYLAESSNNEVNAIGSNGPIPLGVSTPIPVPANDNDIRGRMEKLLREKQAEIIAKLGAMDSKASFRIDEYSRPSDGGYGITTVIEDGSVWEKGGVNISVVQGVLPPAAIKRMRADHKSLDIDPTESLPFWVCGLSLIMHPQNPKAPTVHLNYRYFETDDGHGRKNWWFGGGSDLTPTYLYEDDAKLFHTELKRACDSTDLSYYGRFKKWCDEYFYVKHRREGRGIGGIFFDDLSDHDPKELVGFCGAALEAFLRSYVPIIERRKDLPFTPAQREWQLVRRGRYVEFNLVHDRGTHFGLQTPGSRVESILVSLPRSVLWYYDHHPDEGSEEAKLVDVLQNPRDWIE